MKTDTSEKGLEALIVAALTGKTVSATAPLGAREEAGACGGAGYVQGDRHDYDGDHAVDVAKLLDFLRATQPELIEQLGLAEDSPRRNKFLARLQGEIAKRGVSLPDLDENASNDEEEMPVSSDLDEQEMNDAQ